jgi:ABC-type branched-subunit amino acid transport system substrate-binding protein
LCPAVAIDAAAIYAKANVIQFVPTVTSVELTRKNFDNVFRIAANDEQEAQALAAYLGRDQVGKKLAVVYGDVFYRRAMTDLVKTALPAEMKSTARFEPLAEVSSAYDRLVEKPRCEPPDVLYMALGAAQVEQFVAKLRKQGVKSLLMGGQHLLSESFLRAAGGKKCGWSLQYLLPSRKPDRANKVRPQPNQPYSARSRQPRVLMPGILSIPKYLPPGLPGPLHGFSVSPSGSPRYRRVRSCLTMTITSILPVTSRSSRRWAVPKSKD